MAGGSDERNRIMRNTLGRHVSHASAAPICETIHAGEIVTAFLPAVIDIKFMRILQTNPTVGVELVYNNS
jgi:hypothetical protein